jgi:fatty acid/phospholipid biosynthesis enzyme
VGGACLIGHGKSSAKAIRNAIRFADSYAASGVIETIGDKILEVLAGSSKEGND